MIAFVKKLFSKKYVEEIKETTTTRTNYRCYICGEGEDESQELEYLYVEAEPVYGMTRQVTYHRECVEHLICNAENIPAESFGDLVQAVQIVQQWKKNELRDKKAAEEFERQLADSKLFICKEE